jgi:hypothetical protein
MALDIEDVVGCCMYGKKSLGGSNALEPLHVPLPSSGWLVAFSLASAESQAAKFPGPREFS